MTAAATLLEGDGEHVLTFVEEFFLLVCQDYVGVVVIVPSVGAPYEVAVDVHFGIFVIRASYHYIPTVVDGSHVVGGQSKVTAYEDGNIAAVPVCAAKFVKLVAEGAYT